MKYEMERIAKIASSAQFNIELGQLSKITKNRLIKAFEDGYLPMTSGDASMFYNLLATHVEAPIIQFSKKDKYWDCLITRHMINEGKPLLSDWWKADRVLFRMEKPEEWNKYITQGGYYEEYFTKEPNWHKDHQVRILSDKSVDKFERIAQGYVNTKEYQQKKEKVLEMIKQAQIITYHYVL